MEGGIFYTDSSTENSDMTSAVVLTFVCILGAIGTLLAILR